MTRIIMTEDCGNSPKNLLIKDVTIAFAERNTQFLQSIVTLDFRWSIIGEKVIDGKEAFIHELEQLAKKPTQELTIHHIATHGKAGALNGVFITQDGATIAFCNMYEFGNAKGTTIKEVITYRITI